MAEETFVHPTGSASSWLESVKNWPIPCFIAGLVLDVLYLTGRQELRVRTR